MVAVVEPVLAAETAAAVWDQDRHPELEVEEEGCWADWVTLTTPRRRR